MSLSRSTLGASFLRPFVRRTAPLSSRLPMTAQRYASQDYGSGDGNPVGENPQEQGSNPSADLEHPGPPPPKAGQGSGGGPTKGTSDGHNTEESVQNGGKSSGKSSDSDSSSDSKSSSTKGAQPKILNESPPEPSEQDADVKKHNKAMENRAEQAHEKIG